MKISRMLTATSILLLVFTAMFLGGCGRLDKKQSTVQAAVPHPSTEQPVSQTVSQPVKTEPAKPENNNLLLPELGAQPAQANTTGNREKLVYLTFDDGPNSHFTGKVLDILAEKNVKATFFVVGANVRLNPDVMKRIVAEGHGVANHTYSHDYKTIYKSPEAFLADLEKNNEILLQYTGMPVRIFRAPGGPHRLSSSTKEKLLGTGYISVSWNVTSADSDANGVTAEQELNNIVKDLERVERMKKSPILLMHDGTQLTTTEAKPGTSLAKYVQNREATVKALPEVIELFKSKGYRFALVDENTPPAW
ncbi:MAG: polysaccharide deacetylase family protein [Bacillota bacterium]